MKPIELTEAQLLDILLRRARMQRSLPASRGRYKFPAPPSFFFDFLTNEDYLLVQGKSLLRPWLLTTPEECCAVAWQQLASYIWNSVCRRTKMLWRLALGKQ